jgi:predicted CXXCH cytochrome family protein
MQGLISLALYAAALIGTLYSSQPGQPWVFAAGTGHAGLDCVACHHVHAPEGVRAQWQSPGEPIPHFPFYRSRIDTLDEGSKLCLSCHDGAIAPAVSMPQHALIVSEIGRSVGVTGGRLRFPMGNHPVGVRYDAGSPRFAREPGLRDGVEIPLPDGRVQCVSCHDPHGTTGHEHLLWVSNRRSGLCLSCHRM